jgi:crotonobetainyl-CoA:carnitine CoA-transferase CaiB-like acyl-CoA transferase
MTNKDIVEDAHLAARGFMVEWDQPAVGVRKYPGFPIHFSALPPVTMRPCPVLGQDNRYVLADVLDTPAAVIAELERNGVLADAPPRV